jgi:thiosulfate sulfurtransferase
MWFVKESFKHMNIDKAKEFIDTKNVTIVDIRDKNSFIEGHIANAISVSDENIEQFITSTDKNIPLICYCYHGISSQNASNYFTENGFTEVYSIDGGFEEWNSTHPVVTD